MADINLGACFVQYQSGCLMFYVCQCILYQPIYFSKGNANDAAPLVYKLGCVQTGKVQWIFWYKPGVAFLVNVGICMKAFIKQKRIIVFFFMVLLNVFFTHETARKLGWCNYNRDAANWRGIYTLSFYIFNVAPVDVLNQDHIQCLFDFSWPLKV